MPTKPPTPCAARGCPALTPAGQTRCDEHRRERKREYDRQRGTAAERGYGSRWQKARKRYLRRNPLCVKCLEDDVTREATVVDHITPHKGDCDLFWDRSNWQALCKPHHDRATATYDGGFGNPVKGGKEGQGG